MANQYFAKKSLKMLMEEMAGEHRLKRVLGLVALTSLGIGAVIGAGIFVATGKAANDTAGPALMVSYLFAGITCVFAALCYAEFASMAPVAGSAYTYAYTTLGELFAWIIGWDRVLEYAVGAATVANSWSGYFQEVIYKFGIIIPVALMGPPYKYDQGYILPNSIAQYDGHDVAQLVVKDEKARWPDGTIKPAKGIFWVQIHREATKIQAVKQNGSTLVIGPVGDPAVEAKIQDRQQASVNLLAILIALLVTALLVKGIQESAGLNALMVGIKVSAVLFVIGVGAFYIHPENWTRAFAPYGWTGLSFFGIPVLGQTNAAGEPVGMLAGAAIIFFAYIGFDAVSTQAEEAKNPKRDVPIGIMVSLLICTILYIGVVAVLTGMVPYLNLSKDAAVSDAFNSVGLNWAAFIIALAGVAGITSVLLVMLLSAPRVFLAMARDGLVPKKIFASVHPRFQTPWISTILIGVCVAGLTGFLPIDALLHLTNIGTLFAFIIVCAAVLIMRRIDPHTERPFRCPFVPAVPILGMAACLLLMLSLPYENWLRLIAWLAIGLCIYFFYGRHHSVLGKALRAELAAQGASGSGNAGGRGPTMTTAATPHEGPTTGEAAPAFQQKLGPFDAVMLVAGTMIGSAIFVVSSTIAREVGSSGWLVAIWLLTGAMTIMGALSYAELAGMMPHAGGQYVFLREAYSPLWGFLYGWTCFLVIQTGSIAAVGVVFAKYLGVFWPDLDKSLYQVAFIGGKHYTIHRGHLVAAAVVIFLTLLNCRGLREGKWVQNLFTLTKTAGLVLLIVLGLTVAANPAAIAANTADLWSGIYRTDSYRDAAKLVPSLAALMVMGASMTGALFAADAWNNVTFTAGEVRDAHRTLPRCLAVGTGLVIGLYMLVNLAYLAALPVAGTPNGTTPFERGIAYVQDQRVATAVMEIASPGWGVSFMAIAIMVSTFGCINGMALMGARLYYAMARDGLFFQSVGRLNRRGVPAAGLILQGAWSVLLIFSGSYDDLLDYVMFAALLFYVLTVIGLFILRYKRPDLERPYRAFGYPVIPAVYVLLCAAIMIDLLIVKPIYTWPGLILVLAGIPVYYFWRLRVKVKSRDR